MDASKLIIPFYIGMGVMGIVIRVFWFILLNEKIDDRVRISTGVFQFMSYFGYVIAIIGIILMTYYAVIIRYYRSIYGNEGYLTNTLPIETYEIILAKLITFFGWFVVNGIIIFFTFWFISGEINTSLGCFASLDIKNFFIIYFSSFDIG